MIFARLKMFITLLYKLFHVSLQLLYGSWKISRLSMPIISIFGGARIQRSSFYFERAQYISKRLLAKDISILTGGGTGIMEAISQGAGTIKAHCAKNIGIGVRGLNEKPSVAKENYFELDYFFARKWLLTQYSKAFIIFPGGYGTLDELFEILNLMHNNKMVKVPILLIGSEFWGPLLEWLNHIIIPSGALAVEDIGYIQISDDLDEVISIVAKACQQSSDQPTDKS